MTTWSEQRRAATRERLAFAGWWAGLAFACGAGLVAFVWTRWPTVGLFAAVALAGAWLGPILAWASLRAPRRHGEPWPAAGADCARWRRQANALGRMLLYHQDDPALPRNVRQEIREAHRELRSVLRGHSSAGELERECVRLRDGVVRLAKRTAWLAVWPQVKDLETQWFDSPARALEGAPRQHLLHELVGAAAAAASEGVLPRLLARERWECVELSTDYALQLAAVPGRPFVSPIALAAAIAIGWGDFSGPVDPEADRAALVEFFAANGVETPLVPDRPVPGMAMATRAAEGAEPAPAAAPSAPEPKRYRRVRVRVRHERHSHRSLWTKLVGEPIESVRRGCASFSQWVRYAFRAWWMYR